MRRLPLALAALLLTVPTPAAEAAQRRCAERGTTLARTLEARVYVVARADGQTHELRGCHRRTGRRRVLDTWYSCDCSVGDEQPPRVVAITGRFVAVADSYGCGPFPCETTPGLRVMDVRTGRTTHTVAGGSAARGLLLKRNGSLAYVLGEELIRADRTGTAVVDTGPGIDPLSLAAAPGRLYWMHGDAPRAAPFR